MTHNLKERDSLWQEEKKACAITLLEMQCGCSTVSHVPQDTVHTSLHIIALIWLQTSSNLAKCGNIYVLHKLTKEAVPKTMWLLNLKSKLQAARYQLLFNLHQFCTFFLRVKKKKEKTMAAMTCTLRAYAYVQQCINQRGGCKNKC